MPEIIDLTSSPEPDQRPAHARFPRPRSPPRPSMPFRESPVKRRKTSHIREHEEQGRDTRGQVLSPSTALPQQTNGPLQNGHSVHLASRTEYRLAPGQHASPVRQSLPCATGAHTAPTPRMPNGTHGMSISNDFPHGLPIPVTMPPNFGSQNAVFHSTPPQATVIAPGPASAAAVPPSPTQRPPARTALKGSTAPKWSEEEDMLIVYLRNGLRWNFSQIAEINTERTKGAANTRYCNHLKTGHSLRKAIEVLQHSRWAHVLQPDKHDELLARATPEPQPQPQPQPQPRPPFASLDDAFSAGDDATGAQRERRNANRPANYYANPFQFDHEETDNVVEPLPTGTHPSAHDLGKEIQGVNWAIKTRATSKTCRAIPPNKPYLSYNERSLLHKGLEEGIWDSREFDPWRGVQVHMPFSKKEAVAIERVALDVFGHSMASSRREATSRLTEILSNATEPKIMETAAVAREEGILEGRTKESIEAFLRDAADSHLTRATYRLEPQRRPGISSLLHSRELGRRVASDLKSRAITSYGPALQFTGTSGDVNTVAWAPNGVHFAAGSACLVDEDSMQYNRPCNLLFGDTHTKTLTEFPDHYTLREKTESGVNSSNSMHVTQDRRLFQTVSAVAFSPDGSTFYSAGYDQRLRRYHIAGSNREPDYLSLHHKGKIDLISVSADGLVATGCQRSKMNAIKVVNPDLMVKDGKPLECSFSSKKAKDRPENCIYPSSLRFDPYKGDYLLAGFSSTSNEEQTCGETCLWNIRTKQQLSISPETRNVFDVAWNPRRWQAPLFAVGCLAGTNVNRGVRSVIKMYDIRAPNKCGSPLELDCPALDMNDVMFCPYDENFIIAGCTNGKTYVWDIRQPRPEEHLYSLVHGEPLVELGDGDAASRERLDTGIRFCSWGHERTRFYTGSSDGVVKSWNLYRAQEDVFVKDIIELNSGVMSGAFSPDYTSLLLGEVNGTVNVLEVGSSDRTIKDAEPFVLKSATPQRETLAPGDGEESEESGITIANSHLQSGKIVYKPMGNLPIRQAVQGPQYSEFWDRAEDAPIRREEARQSQEIFSQHGAEQCTIPACAEGINKITSEEAGDSGRSADRIPGALRSLGVQADGQQGIVMPRLRCIRCGRPARPRPGEDEECCERCDFSCPRCGKQAVMEDDTVERIYCEHCQSLWRADVLGYRLVERSSTVPKRKGRPKSKGTLDKAKRRGHDYVGEDNIEAYYHGLWTDRPPSPL